MVTQASDVIALLKSLYVGVLKSGVVFGGKGIVKVSHAE